MNESILLFILLLILIFINVPIFIALALSATIIAYLNDLDLLLLAQNFISGSESFSLLAIPFFMLAGAVMSEGGVSRRIVDFAKTIVGSFPGGLAHVSLTASLIFSALSGSSTATAAAVGGIMIPRMNQSGYPLKISSSVTAAGAALGPIIPPSILLIVTGVVIQTSITKLFLAAVFPGLLIFFLMATYVYFISKKNGYRGERKYTLKEVGIAFKEGFLGLMMPVIILGGIYGGIFTPTEAAAIGAFYGFIVSVFIYRELNFKSFLKVLVDSTKSTSMVMVIIMSASFFGFILVDQDVPQMVSSVITGLTENGTVFLLIVMLLLLILGTFMNAQPAIIIMAPILYPTALALDIDPIFFGTVLTISLVVGVITPPVGVDLFVTAAVANIRFETLARATFPYVIIMIVAIIITILIPSIAMYLPNLIE